MKMEDNVSSSTSTTKVTNSVNCKPKLVNVHYPGIVKNVDKALETLGGIKNIESVTSSQKKHLELSFRPNNLHSKPVLSDRDSKPNVLVKVKTRKTIKDGKVINREVVDYDVVGITAQNIKFNRLCDFQYLPLLSREPVEKEEELVYAYDEIIPKEIPDIEWISSEECDTTPLYFVPYQFSKLNLHGNQLHFERSKFYEDRFLQEYCDKFKEQQLQQKLYKKDKEKITKSAMLCRFEDDIPTEATAQALETLRNKGVTSKVEEKMKELFARRPIWSRNALLYYSGATNEQMKYILPTQAFHYVSGPWRIMWVRFGYDPKADPEAKMLQTFDYRVRSRGGYKIKIKTKRYTTHNLGSSDKKFSLTDETCEKVKQGVEENFFIMKPGLLPAARQTFFQFCDVKLPEIENMLAKLPAILPGSVCDWKHGWLPNGFADHCREIVNKYIKDSIAKEVRQLKGQTESVKDSSDVSSSSSSESDSDSEQAANVNPDTELDSVIDLETVEEINQLLGHATQKEPEPGPSTSK